MFAATASEDVAVSDLKEPTTRNYSFLVRYICKLQHLLRFRKKHVCFTINLLSGHFHLGCLNLATIFFYWSVVFITPFGSLLRLE